MNNNILSQKDNLKLISILIAITCDYVFLSYPAFSVTWVLTIFILGNVKRISKKTTYSYFFRMSSYFLHFGVFFIFLGEMQFSINNYIYIALLIALSFCIYYFKNFKFLFSDARIAESTKEPKSWYFLIIYNTIGGAICEELYFRGVITHLFINVPILAICLSTLYFCLMHYTLVWSGVFKLTDYKNQLLIGFLSNILFIMSNSLVPSIIVHVSFNIPNIIISSKRYYRHYINPKYFDELKKKDVYDDLPI